MSIPFGPFAPGSVVAVGGSRELPAADSSAGLLALALVQAGHRLVVGCAVGADQAVIAALVGSPALHVCAAFGPVSPPWPGVARYTAPGAWSGSAVGAVAQHLLFGGRVTWWAGGGPARPLVTRLAARTRAVARACTGGALVVLAAPGSRGSLLLAQSVARRGLPVVAVPLGFPARRLPALAESGGWRPLAHALPGVAPAWCWCTGPLPAHSRACE